MPKDVEKEIAAGFLPHNEKYGYQLLNETQKYLGPQAKDPKMHVSGNNLSCTSCHLQAGSQPGAASWTGVTERFLIFGGRANEVGTIEDRINGCLERSMNGEALEVDSRPMKAMLAYMEWLAEDMPEDKKEYYKGFVELNIPDQAVDLEYGKRVFSKDGAVCH